MIAGVGIDAARISRVREMIDRFGIKFTARVFTEAEREYCQGRRHSESSYAARFAAKEAVMKSLGSGWGSGVRFKEIEVERGERGAPTIKLHGGAKKRANTLEIKKLHVSLSHEGDLALAQVVAEKEN